MIFGRPWYDVVITALLSLTALVLAVLIRRERWIGRALCYYFTVKTFFWSWVLYVYSETPPPITDNQTLFLVGIKFFLVTSCLMAIFCVVYERLKNDS
jgi:apolipoprotein N-acyltransferase